MKHIHNKVLYFLYCLLVLGLISAPGFSDLADQFQKAVSNSKNLHALSLWTVLQTDFKFQLLRMILAFVTSICIFSYASFKFSAILSSFIKRKEVKALSYMLMPFLPTLGLFSVNSSLFPNSLHHYYTLDFSQSETPNVLLIFYIALGISAIFVLINAINVIQKKRKVAVFCLAVFSALSFSITDSLDKAQSKDRKKNVILIGVDSLRLEFINENMPTLSKLVSQGQTLKHAITPFARTFPAWSTILSGQYPQSSGAIFNLIHESKLNPDTQYLPQMLKNQGYNTIYISDERRFSYIGKYHGFDHIIGPHTGIGDFVFGQYADHPLINISTHIPMVNKIYPEITNNRAAAKIYSPENFSYEVEDELAKIINEDEPIMMAAHFCLAHWPFHDHQKPKHTDVSTLYVESLQKVDKQIEHLLKVLSNKGVLEDAIVVLLSDHGESWHETLSFKHAGTGELFEFRTNGHGSSIINPNEHDVLVSFLGIKEYRIDTRQFANLADITPTIIEALGLQIEDLTFDGYSLIDGSSTPPPQNRITPIESGFTVKAVKDDINSDEAVSQGLSRYFITNDGLLRLKPEEVDFLEKGKEYGIRSQSQLLGLIQVEDAKKLALLDLNTREIALNEKDNKNFASMKRELCRYYSSSNIDNLTCE